ncbi:MAG: prepilin peptidase [Gammaproteobacteria bacterium]|nr:prepilin peptidase [Gammaproteobacteria bacterium]NIM73697.1 prepilin peptidase [Gammaproteobacteria bacterium]NIN37371.1 prepilin peptidase [Gammaproteobacteria bacterium]NIO25530.1 prepilin peptidase [Gammaproteobacteria bacterium]NIO66205.1 prepilin peptidase [Gammaproteobacteria bacterium]
MLVAQYLAANPPVLLTFTALLGLAVGSFLNVVIFRLPRMMERDWRDQCAEIVDGETEVKDRPAYNLVVPRSRCPSCGHSISALENVPVVSYLFLKGRCAQCGWRIPLRYPLVELLTAVLSVIVVWQLGLSLQAGAALALTWALIALAFIDFDTQLLPDSITLPFLWLGLVLNISGTFTDLSAAVIGAVAGYLILWSVYHVFRLVTGKEGMGFGDFKLLAMFGAWLGWSALPLIVLLSSFVGAVVGVAMIALRGHDRNIPIPFGPYLAVAGWIALLWGGDLVEAYLGVSGLNR